MTLPPAHQRIAARDADRLLKGEWHDLCLLRRKEIEDPIKNPIPLAIGRATEPLNISLIADRVEGGDKPFAAIWPYEKITGSDRNHCPQLVQSKRSGRWYGYDPATRFICKPDALLIGNATLPVECKHSSRNGDFVDTEDRIRGWMPQLQATMLIFQVPYLLLSVLWNTGAHTLYWVPRDEAWQYELTSRAEAFGPYLENPSLEAPYDAEPAMLDPVDTLKFNSKAVRTWLAERGSTDAQQVA